ncbi:hypothetical protein CCICO_01365 [Corynebacterium ciconiae DSM 44920]|uniref:hypothetical protein n=1 Tax=Corynebacterium ciconiae TaxID=227319 RepID=UPI00037FFC04|nr:hypothetical protein [Corynebacterium ciconiae]WKD60327.1 hypothetical protein CCICO_01365 [Corynebacterium ciconiae DSM 44920]
MTTRLSFIDRLVVFIVALLLGALAAPFIGSLFDAQWAQDIFDRVNVSNWPDTVEGTGWIIGLAVTIAVAVLIGLPLVIANLRTHRFSRGIASQDSVSAAGIGLGGSEDLHGRISVEVADLADAAADSIESIDGVERVRTKVYFDRSEPTMQFKILAKPAALQSGLLQELDSVRQSLDEALPETKITIRYVLEMLPNQRRISTNSTV